MARTGRVLLTAALALFACSKQVPTVPRGDPVWINSLGMRFVPVDGTRVLFSVCETRDVDFGVFLKETGSEWIPPDTERGGEYPAANITWDDAVAFCQWLTECEYSAG